MKSYSRDDDSEDSCSPSLSAEEEEEEDFSAADNDGTAGSKGRRRSTNKKTIEQRYQKKTQLEHILLRPDTYVGSLEPEITTTWVWDSLQHRMVNRQITFIPAMYKIFDEILVNAADVKARERHETSGSRANKMTKIDVEIDEENSLITVLNDGSGIPVEMHKEHNVYVPELIFGHLLTSDNYDDNDQRVTGGRNGFGAKLTNIFSETFTVEVIDSKRKRRFTMTWTNNMTNHTQPNITTITSKMVDTVKISFRPDLKRFRCERFEPDLIALMKKRVYDIAGTTGVKVSLNRQRIPIKDFKSYVDLYFQSTKSESVKNDSEDSEVCLLRDGASAVTKESTTNNDFVKIHEKVNDRWEIVVSQSEGQFQQVSFVNSICTTKGGTHVTHVVEPLVNAILKKVNTKNKRGMEIKGHHVKSHLFVFVNSLIVNPTFDSQTKETLTLKPSQFGSSCQISEKTITAVAKSPITETVLLWAQTKQQVDLKKLMKSGGGGRRERVLGVPKLEDANDAGTRNGYACTLILTEGDSAKTSCLAGLSVVGRDRYGVFPLRGKLLNVRDASFKALTENKEIQNILKITGLQAGQKAVDTKQLRYGSLMIMTDQDHDGSHIKGLLINFFHHFWPDLLKMQGFLKEFVTPIVKVSRKNETFAFYTIPEYHAWKLTHGNGKGWKTKYYKGLGTSNDKEFKEYFSQLNDHQLEFSYEDDGDFEAIDMAFNSKRAEDRKAWIQSFEEGTFLDHREKIVNYKDFINKELVLFSKYDAERSIPNVMDGWKPGQRKALFGVFKRNLFKSEMKVAQLASYISEVSCYHHGEESMEGTIVNMAQNFVGSNNINVLEPCGQFGSRKEGGKDASASRYIYTKLTVVARHMFIAADENLLHYNNEEGRVIEPRWYVPVIPLVLINGGEGIGTGWSCSVPNYNPRDIIANLRAFIKGEPMERMIPWYRGFIGRIERSEKMGKFGYESVGKIEKINDDSYLISELPVKVWTQAYKDSLEDWLSASIAAQDAAANNRPAPKRQPKAKASAGGSATSSRTQTGAGPKVYKCYIQDYRDNSSHESISFTIKMTPDQMEIAEQEGLEKIFKLRKSIPTTNMTLFGADGVIQKYETELDIMKEFAKVRLEYYHKRRRYYLTALEREKCLLSNKLKFILQVVENDLIVQKKKKAELVEELRRRGYDTHTQINSRYDTSNPTMQGDVADDGIIREVEEDEDEGAVASAPAATVEQKANDYDYLLGMALWALTYEKVEELRSQLQKKEQELEDYRKRTPEDLWEYDLDQLEKVLEEFEQQLADRSAMDAEYRRRASTGGSRGAHPKRSAATRQTKLKPAKQAVKTEPVAAAEKHTHQTSTSVPTQSTAAATTLTTATTSSPPRDFSLMERLRAKLAAEKQQSKAPEPPKSLAGMFAKVESSLGASVESLNPQNGNGAKRSAPPLVTAPSKRSKKQHSSSEVPDTSSSPDSSSPLFVASRIVKKPAPATMSKTAKPPSKTARPKKSALFAPSSDDDGSGMAEDEQDLSDEDDDDEEEDDDFEDVISDDD